MTRKFYRTYQYLHKMAVAEFNPFSILYLSFRMAPFIVVSFFVLSALLNPDVRGIIYLGGLLICCTVIMGLGSFMPNPQPSNLKVDSDSTLVCNLLTLSENGRVSKLPLSSAVFGFTTGYFAWPIIKQKSAIRNVPTLILFPLLCILDGIWNVSNGCVVKDNAFLSVLGVLMGSIGVSFALGIGWAAMISKKKRYDLLYMNGISSQQTCTLARERKMICSITAKNGGA